LEYNVIKFDKLIFSSKTSDKIIFGLCIYASMVLNLFYFFGGGW